MLKTRKRISAEAEERKSPKRFNQGLVLGEKDEKNEIEDRKEESFESILSRFAKMGLENESDGTQETCFLCLEKLSLKDYAEHVYTCVDKLRRVEEADHLASMAAAGVPVCRDGCHCAERGYQHFMSVYHPPAVCPVCDEKFSLYEIDAHLNFCLSAGSRAPEGYQSQVREIEDFMDTETKRGRFGLKIGPRRYMIDLNEMLQMNCSTGNTRTIRRTDMGWKWEVRTGEFIPFDPQSNIIIERHMEELFASSPDASQGTKDTQSVGPEDEKKERSKKCKSEFVQALDKESDDTLEELDLSFSENSRSDGKTEQATEKTNPTEGKANPDEEVSQGEKSIPAGSKLTTRQLAACAALIVKEKNKPDVQKSVSLARLMQSFKSLGITKENLKASMGSS
ncbi:hypothetical protein AAMO2058_001748000 [Amorphochlora amoebiformis]|mmetsp:Transcript_5892/g.9025  ORF Transcript_5892/g.9025 Transcript_5892/m.9025 type:complete len:395 (-) Transcript_5892:96-1280(-)|eukprot:1395163-Amorphochlora_amoeboformis.AAC.1